MKHPRILFIFLLFISFLSVAYLYAIATDGNGIKKTDAPLYDWAFIGDNGLIYITPHRENCNEDGENYEYYFPEKFGVIDRTGKTIIDGKERWVKKINRNEPYAVFGEEGLGEGIMDKNFKVILPASDKREIEVFGDYAAIKSPNSKFLSIFYIKDMKNIATLPATLTVMDISDSMILTLDSDNNYSFYDLLGQQVISPTQLANFVEVCGFYENRALVINDEEHVGFIDKNGKLIIPCRYVKAEELDDGVSSFFSNGLSIVREPGSEKCGAIDRNGKKVIPFKYSWIERFLGNTTIAVEDDYDESVEIDNIGRVIKHIPLNYWDYKSGLTSFDDPETGLKGYKNLKGEVVIPARFIMADSFTGDLAIVKTKDGLSLINSKGEILIPNISIWCVFDMAG